MARPRVRRRAQPRHAGGRPQVSAALSGPVLDRLDALAARFGVSRSWAEHQLLADALHLDIDARFDTPLTPRKRRR